VHLYCVVTEILTDKERQVLFVLVEESQLSDTDGAECPDIVQYPRNPELRNHAYPKTYWQMLGK
jgi:hypothetical protein